MFRVPKIPERKYRKRGNDQKTNIRKVSWANERQDFKSKQIHSFIQHMVETLLYAGDWIQQWISKALAPLELAFLCGRKTGRVVWNAEDIDKHNEPAGHMEKAPPHKHHVKFLDAKVKRSSLKQTIYKSTRIRLVSDFSLATRMLEY